MEATELLTALGSSPIDGPGIEKAIEETFRSGGTQALGALLSEVIPQLSRGEGAEALLKALDAIFRRNRDSELGVAAAWHAGVIGWKVFADLGKAEFFMKSVGDVEPYSEEWRAFYRQFYASRGNWLRLEQFMADISARTGMSQTEVKRTLARTARDFDNAPKELSYWQALAQAVPDDPEADRELERLYTKLERWPSLTELLRARIRLIPEDAVAEKVAILEKMIEIYRDKMKAEPKVLATYQNILEVDPTNQHAVDALLERYEASGRWPDYAKVLARKIESTTDTAELIRLRERQAEIMETRFANAVEALKSYEEILKLAPERRDVLEKLKDLYDKRRDYENLIRIRLLEADRLSDPGARAHLLVELAQLATERLRKVPVAIDLWEQVRQLSPTNVEAMRNLEALYEREKDTDRLCDILKQRIELATSDAERVQILEKLANIYGSKLADSLAALETWKRILEVQPTHDRAKRELRSRFLAEHKWDELEWFLRKFGSVDELARTLESQLPSVSDADEKRRMLYKLAAMWRDELGQPTRAVKNLEAVLALVEDDLQAATELIALYRSLSDYKKLPAVYDIAIAKTTDRQEKMRLMVEAAEIHEKNLRNLDRAFFWYVSAFKEDMLDDRLRAELERLAGPSENWDTYVAVLEEAAAIMEPDKRQVATWLRVGQIHSQELGDAPRAIEAFKRALELDGENWEAITSLEAIYREVGDHESLIDILRRRLRFEPRDELRREGRFDIAGILYHKLNRVDEAIGTYEEILSGSPAEARAYEELSEVLLAERRFPELLALLQRQVRVFSQAADAAPGLLADLHCRIATLTYGLQGPCPAVVESAAKTLGYIPNHANALALLEDLLAVQELRLPVVALLRGSYESLGRLSDLADLIEIELAERGDSAVTVPLLWEAYALYSDGVHDDRKAFRTLSRILAVTPEDEAVWDKMDSAARTIGAWRDLASRFEEACGHIASLEAQVQLRLRLARVYLDEIHNTEQARRIYHEVLAVDDANTDALEALESIYESIGNHPELLKIYQKRFDVSPYPGEKVAYAFKMAAELSDHLRDVEGAIEAVKRVLDIDPEYAAAYRQLDTLYARAERWEDLASVLVERIRLAETDSERTYLRLRLGEVKEDKLGDLVGAVDVYRVILEADRSNDEAVARLERLFPNETVRVMIAPILLPAYRERHDYPRLVEVYNVLADAESDLEARLNHYETIARIYEDDLVNPEMAFEFWAKAFRAAPDRENLVAEVLRVGGVSGGLMDAVMVLCEKVFDIADPVRRMATHRTIARECRDAAGDRDLAKRHFNEVLLMDAADMDALDSLIAMHREDEEIEPLVTLLLRKSDLVSESAERADLLLQAGDLTVSALNRPEDAIRIYTQVLDLDPMNRRAIEALEDLYFKAERWDAEVEILTRKAQCAPTTEDRVEALRKKGLVQHERMGNTAEAIETFLEVHAQDPKDVEALRTLDRLYGIQEDWLNLYNILEKLYALLDGRDQLTVHLRMGGLLEHELADPFRAVKIYEDILVLHPDNKDAVDALEAMVRGGEAADEAFAVLSPALAERGEWERLYVVYDLITEREEDVARKVRNLLTMGEIAEQRIGESIRAFECYGRAFTTDPQNTDALDKIESLAAAQDMWENVPALLLEGAKAIDGTPEALSLRLRAAGIQRDRLDDKAGAASSFEAVVADFPDNRQALSALDGLYGEMGRFADLARTLRLEIEATGDTEEKIGFLLRLGMVAESSLDDSAAALEARREVLALRPGQEEAVAALRGMFDAGKHRGEILELLEPIYREGSAWQDLATIYEAVLGAITDTFERKQVLLKLADVWLDRLYQPETGLGWLGQALVLEPVDESLLVRIEELAAANQAYSKLLDILMESASAAEEDERRVYLWHKAAACARDRIGQTERAESIYRWILDVDNADVRALAALDAMFEAQGRYADLLGILERECDVADYDDDKIAFFMRAGEIQRDRLNDSDGAVYAFRQVLRINDNHREALTALADLHTAREEYEDLFKVLGTLSDVATAVPERLALLRRMARIAEDNLDQKETALNLWEEISRTDTGDIEALRELQRLYQQKQDWNAFVDTCERELPLIREDVVRATDLLRQVARAAEEFLSDAYQAQQAWRRILDVAPSDIEAMQALRRLYRDSGDLESLSGILAMLADSGAFSGGDLLALYEEHATLLTDELPKPQQAIEWWSKVIEVQPEHLQALEALERLYEDTGRIADCVGILKRRAALTRDSDVRAELLLHASDLQADRIKDMRAAAETLEEIFAFAPDNLEAAERLQNLYMKLEDWDRLADVLLRRDTVLTDPDERLRNLNDLARVYEERKGDREAAFLILVKAVEVQPGDEMTLADAWRLAQLLGNWVDYVECIGQFVDRMPDPIRLDHLLRFGEVMWKQAGRLQDAVPFFERVLEKWPEDATALAALTDLYSALDRHRDLIGNLTRRVELTPDYVEKVQFQLWAGRVYEEKLGDGDGALLAYAKVLEFDDANLDALNAMARLYRNRRDWENLLKTQAMLADLQADKAVEIRLDMGAILEEELNDPERAIAAYEEVLNLEPTQAHALDRLQALYGQLNNWRGLCDVYERLLDMTSEIPDRILFCNRLAILYEEALGDKAQALDYYQRILDMDPSDEEVFETAVRLMTELEMWTDLVSLLESKVSRVADTATKVATLQRIAETYETRNEDVNAAVSTYQRMLALDPGHVPAYAELTRLFTQMEAWEDVVGTILNWKEHVENDHEYTDLMLRAATILKDRLENPDRALSILGTVLKVDPANEAAAEKMRLIYGELEEWEKVAEVYLRQEPHATSDDHKARIRAAVGDVYMNRLKDRARAIQHYERALELNPKLKDVSLSLARTYVAAERWEKAEPLLELLLGDTDVTSDPARAAEVRFQIGLCAEKLLDFDRAFREYQIAAKLAPDHAFTTLGLARLYQRKQLWQLAKDHYLKGLDSAGDTLSDRERLPVEFALGEVSLQLGELDEATSYLDRVLELDPNHARATDILIAIAERRGDWPSVIRYKQNQLQAKLDPFERFALWLEVGDIYKSKLNNPFGAVAAYREAFKVNPDGRVALLRLYNLYLETNQIDDALSALEQLARMEEAVEKKATHYMAMAALYREKLGETQRAIEYLNMALDADPDRLEAFRAIDEILTQAKNWEAQAEAYRRMLDRIKGRGMPDLEFKLWFNCGEIYRTRLRQLDMSISAFTMAAKCRPEERRTHEILAQLFEISGDQLDKAVEEHRSIIATAPLGHESAASYKAIRRLFLEMREFDKAFMTASVLCALGYADPAEAEFFEGNLEPGLPWFKGTIDPLRWESHLMSKTQDTVLGRIFQVLYMGLGVELGAKELKDLGLKKKNEMDLELKLLFNNVYKGVAKALGGLQHKVYRDDSAIGMKVEFLSPPALIIGADMLTGREEREVAFMLGRELSYLHPMHFLARVKNMTELKVLLAGVLKFCRPETPLGGGADVVLELVRLIERRMPQQQKNQLGKLLNDLVQREAVLDFGALIERFFVAMERSTLRAGTLVAGSVPAALAVLKGEDMGFSGLSQRERMEEVVRFAISDDHFVLRRALGVAVENPGV